MQQRHRLAGLHYAVDREHLAFERKHVFARADAIDVDLARHGEARQRTVVVHRQMYPKRQWREQRGDDLFDRPPRPRVEPRARYHRARSDRGADQR